MKLFGQKHRDHEDLNPMVALCQRILDGPWQWIQLRGATGVTEWLEQGEVDLLGNEESLTKLIHAAGSWVKQGLCHLRIRRNRIKKTNLLLISLDGRHRIELDLWVQLNQIDGGRSWTGYDHLASLLENVTPAISRLPLRLEFGIYLHHLACKKKNLGAISVSHRFEGYRHLAQQLGDALVLKAVSEITRDREALSSWLVISLKWIQEVTSLQTGHVDRGCGRWWRELFLDGTRRPRCLSLIGCDGSGKSTLVDFCLEKSAGRLSYKKGKHLYRKSWVYKLAVIFIRPLLLRDREQFDEMLAGWVYLRACLGIRLTHVLSKAKPCIMDRGLMDFLYLARKTDHPRFSLHVWMARWFGLRVPTIHLVLPFELLKSRKEEITANGHRHYDEDMFLRYSSLIPSDYTLFYNGMPMEKASIVMHDLLGECFPTLKGLD